MSRNWILTDVVQIFYPNRVFVNRELQHGHFPLWNPYILTGQPAVPAPVMALFYPTTLALSWLSAGESLDMEILIHLFVVTLGMYLLVRVLGGKPPGGVAAAAAFAGCSTLTGWQQYGNIFNSGAWLPWLAAFFVLAQRGRRPLWIGAGGIALGLVHLSNDIQWVVYDLFFLGCYALWLACRALPSRDWRLIARPLADATAIVILGFAIGAVQFLPLWELASLSSRTAGVNPPYAYVEAFAAPKERLLSAIAPNFFGTPAVAGSEWLSKSNYPESLVYWGFFPLILALTAPLWRRTASVWFLWVFLLFSASMVFGSPVLHLYALIPGVNILAVQRMSYLLCFAGATLCGLVMHNVFAGGRPWRPLIVLGGLALVAQDIVQVALAYFRPQPALTLEPTYASIRWVSLLVLLGGLIFIVALLHWRPARHGAHFALMLLIVLDIAHFNLPYNSATTNEATLFPRPKIFNSLPSSVAPIRVAPINQKDSVALLAPNILEVFGIADIGADEALLLKNYEQFFRRIEPTPFKYNGWILVITQYSSPLLDLAGVEYIVSTTPLDTTKGDLEFVASADTLNLYHNREAAPRAFIVTNVKNVATSADVWPILSAPDYKPCSVAVVQSTAPVSTQSAPKEGCIGNAVITSYEPNRVSIHAEVPVDGFLVLSDSYYPGWHVLVDGREQQLYQTNGTFRGVALSAGSHEVSFVFRPTIVMVGGAISIVGLICALCLIAFGTKSLRKRRIRPISIEVGVT